jgi:hypothetical protein
LFVVVHVTLADVALLLETGGLGRCNHARFFFCFLCFVSFCFCFVFVLLSCTCLTLLFLSSSPHLTNNVEQCDDAEHV